MWDWFTQNSIWFLSTAAAGLTVLVFLRNRFKDGLAGLKPEQRDIRRNRVIRRVFLWEMIALVLLIIASMVAVILSSDGANASLNTEVIKEWLLSKGIVILAYIIVAYVIYRLVKLIIPKLVIRIVKSSGKGRHSKSWFEKRAQTMSNMLSWAFGFIIGLITLFMILSKLTIDITPMLASAGVAGIAIGFGAQSLVKDFVSGMFILLEDQFNKGDVIKIAGIFRSG
ncbi:mechanosensitive ion channel family protein [Chloroflexota bacterium]